MDGTAASRSRQPRPRVQAVGPSEELGPREQARQGPLLCRCAAGPRAKYQDFFTTPVKHPTDGVALHYPTLRTNKQLGDRRAWDTW